MNIGRLENDPVLAGLGLSRDELEQIVSDLAATAGDPKWLAEAVLARACAQGSQRAWERFLTLYREKLFRAAAAITKGEEAGRELAGSVLGELYGSRVDGAGRRVSKLQSYAGRGPLEAWLRTVLAQEQVNRCRAQKRFVNFDEALGVAGTAEIKEELTFEQLTQLAGAVDAALASLSSEERLLMAAYYLDERTLAEVGRMLSVHESTVSRRLEKVTKALRKRVVKELARNGVSKRAAEEMLALDVKELVVDVRARLPQERPL